MCVTEWQKPEILGRVGLWWGLKQTAGGRDSFLGQPPCFLPSAFTHSCFPFFCQIGTNGEQPVWYSPVIWPLLQNPDHIICSHRGTFLAPEPEQNFSISPFFSSVCISLSSTPSSHWKAITGALGRIFYEYQPLFSSLHIYPPASPPSPSPPPPSPPPPFPPPSSFLLSAYLSSTGSTLPLPANNTVWIEEKETEIKYVFFQISRDGCFQFVLTSLAFTQLKVWTGRKYLHSGLRLVHRWKYFKVFICWKYLSNVFT